MVSAQHNTHTLCGHSGERTAQSSWRRRTTIINNDQTRSPPPLIFCATRKNTLKYFVTFCDSLFPPTQNFKQKERRECQRERQEGMDMVAGTRAAEKGLELEATMQQLHAYPPKQRSCCHMDCPLSDLVRRGRSAGRLCQ